MNTATPTTRPTTTPLGAIPVALADIKLAHSVFALPFALLAAALALPTDITTQRVAGLIALIVICMVLARTWAMLINRLADHRFDADNPRTARRAVASGRLTPRAGWTIASITALLFIATCAGFELFFANPWPVALSVPVLAWIALYSYTKRFTALCHFFLGSALAISPIAACIAVNPDALMTSETGLPIALIALFVLLWVAGFDVAYALQDLDFDRETGLRSIPAALGTNGALWSSRIMHATAFAGIVLAWLASPVLGTFFAIALALTLCALITEHTVLHRQGVRGLPLAFFTLNGIISIAIAIAGIADVIADRS
jgi:4-hydroxybenzoate polyprenyltransferase